MLAVLTRLTVLTLLTLLPALAIAVATTRIHGLQLTAQALDAIESGIGAGLLAWTLAVTQGFLRITNLVAQILQAGGNLLLGIGRIRIHAAAQPVSAFLDAILGVIRVEVAESVAQFAGGGALVGGEIALRVAHLLLQLREIVCQALAFISEFLRFLWISLLTVTIVGLAETSGEGRGTWHLAKLLLLIFFLLSEAVSFAGHGIEAAVGVLLLRTAEKILRLAETVCGAARFGAAGLRAAHVVIRFAQTLQRLRYARIGGTLLTGLSSLTRLT